MGQFCNGGYIQDQERKIYVLKYNISFKLKKIVLFHVFPTNNYILFLNNDGSNCSQFYFHSFEKINL
jgi:hypothetical protein